MVMICGLSAAAEVEPAALRPTSAKNPIRSFHRTVRGSLSPAIMTETRMFTSLPPLVANLTASHSIQGRIKR
jgi:hypothetical protein